MYFVELYSIAKIVQNYAIPELIYCSAFCPLHHY